MNRRVKYSEVRTLGLSENVRIIESSIYTSFTKILPHFSINHHFIAIVYIVASCPTV